jgi:hypothetical protein
MILFRPENLLEDSSLSHSSVNQKYIFAKFIYPLVSTIAYRRSTILFQFATLLKKVIDNLICYIYILTRQYDALCPMVYQSFVDWDNNVSARSCRAGNQLCGENKRRYL